MATSPWSPTRRPWRRRPRRPAASGRRWSRWRKRWRASRWSRSRASAAIERTTSWRRRTSRESPRTRTSTISSPLSRWRRCRRSRSRSPAAWVSTTGSTPGTSDRGAVIQVLNLLLGGVFHAAALFLVAAGLQLVFGVQRILNLACGSFYALGAYCGVTAGAFALGLGVPAVLALPVLILAGASIAVIGPPIEPLLRLRYERDEGFQLLLTFALVLMLQDLVRMGWGSNPQQIDGVYLAYGQLRIGAARIPVWNLLVLAAALVLAMALGGFLQRTNFGRLLRATAENR